MNDQELDRIIRKLNDLAIRRSLIDQEQAAVVEALRQRLPVAPPATVLSKNEDTSLFEIGEIVFITNAGLLPIGQRHLRFGIVTSISTDKRKAVRVYIERVGLGSTWRSPKNLRKTTNQERAEYETILHQRQRNLR